ncbi:MAG: glycosyltransferase family 25 protein [Chlamydiales bacterium]|nr:glycosyltransferase family 25 protein [Chlamydiia bacterium]MCP5508265.1 glycosyltransferase family 25 protein [Chlamydiales bacterium]
MPFRRSIFFLLLLSTSLAGDVLQHLHPCTGKIDKQELKHVDFIYLINLDERPEKLANTLKELEPYGIHPYRFSAVNGWRLSLEVINDVGVRYQPWMQQGYYGTCYLPENKGQQTLEKINIIGRNYFCQTLSLGAIGCCMSHLSVLKDAYDSGYETIWVMEDDIQVLRSPHLISKIIEDLDAAVGSDGWDILYTDRDTKGSDGKYVICESYYPRPNFVPGDPSRFAMKRRIAKQIRQVGARYGTYSMIIRRSGIRKLLDFFRQYQVFLPYDMDIYLPEEIRMFTVMKDIVSTYPTAASDNRIPGYFF